MSQPLSPDVDPQNVLDEWGWPERKRLELWINVELGRFAKDEAPIDEIRSWLRDVMDEHGWRRVPYHVRALFEPAPGPIEPGAPIRSRNDEGEWTTRHGGPLASRTLWEGVHSTYAHQLKEARAALEHFEKEIVKRRQRIDLLLVDFAGHDNTANERRDKWFAEAVPCAIDMFRSRAERELNAKGTRPTDEDVRRRLRWLMSARYHQLFGGERYGKLGRFNPFDWTERGTAIDALIDSVRESKAVQEVLHNREGKGGNVRAAHEFVAQLLGWSASTARDASKKVQTRE